MAGKSPCTSQDELRRKLNAIQTTFIVMRSPSAEGKKGGLGNSASVVGLPSASEACVDAVDLRVRHTCLLLQDSLPRLMREKEFDRISKLEIADGATVNRATFFDHYPDKFAPLECTVATRFHGLLEQCGVRFDGSLEHGTARHGGGGLRFSCGRSGRGMRAADADGAASGVGVGGGGGGRGGGDGGTVDTG